MEEYTAATQRVAAVSVRRREGPRDRGTKPATRASAISSEEKSPSGPMRNNAPGRASPAASSPPAFTAATASISGTRVFSPAAMSLSQYAMNFFPENPAERTSSIRARNGVSPSSCGGLLGGRDDDPLPAFLIVHLPLGMGTEQGCDPVHSHLSGFLSEPLETVDILSRSHGHPQPVGMRPEAALHRKHPGHGRAAVSLLETAAVEIAVPSAHIDLIPHPVSEHLDTVSGLLGRETDPPVADII